MQLDFKARELTVKLVYYGPALSGKTTNLQAIHRLVSPETSGRLMTLETRDDRTLFFDLLPLSFAVGNGLQVRIKLFTVPGQVIHNATRRLVLQGADGVAFIADSQKNETKANQAAFLNMQENLVENGLDPDKCPIVIQFNKRDMPNVRTDEEIDRLAQRGKEPVFKAIATRGVGVMETFYGLLELTWRMLERDHQLHAKFGIDPEAFLSEVRARLAPAGEPDVARAEHRGVDIALADVGRLEEIVDREALNEVCRSFFDLFGLPVHVFSEGGSPLADVHEEREICRYLNTLPAGHIACVKTVSAVKDVIPTEMVVHACFTGAVYRIVPCVYQGRRVGRFVIGPYLPAETREVPKSLLVVDPNLDKERARAALTTMPRVREETAERIAQHLARVVDLLLFSSHRAHLTSEMHIASVRESYRELAEKNAKLQAAYDRLRELDRLKSNFLATVSHELRTPLTSIIGYSEMLESGIAGELQGEQLEFVQTIRTKGDHLLALITSLLDLSKLEQGTLKLKLEPLDARAMLEDVAKTLGPTASKKNVRLEVKVDAELPEVEVDPVRMRQILWNLSENAVKFTPPSGTVHLGATATELEDDDGGGLGAVLMSTPRRAIAFTIRDTGIGMPRDELPKIFDAFYQIDGSSTREHGGAGLGLSIVRRLVDAHGGRIEVDSEVGQGTTFTITIPEPKVDD